MKHSKKRITNFRHELKLLVRNLFSKFPRPVGPKKGPMMYNEVFPGNEGYLHRAVDYYADFGSPILASSNGLVHKIESDHLSSAGTSMTIYHHPYKMSTSYHHLDKVLVTVGQEVRRGDIIGTVGLSGRRGPHDSRPPSIPHLHFIMSVKNEYVDPEKYIVGCFDPEKSYRDQDHTYPVPCKSTLFGKKWKKH